MAPNHLKTLLILSHVVALGAGVWWSATSSSSEGPDLGEVEESPDSKPIPQYRISSGRILGALEFDSPFFPKTPPSTTPRDERSPHERAAEVVDFKAEMQSQVEVFNQTGFPDYRFTQEMIYRWMSLDPQEAMDYFATVEIRSGWSDPWRAMFKNSCSMSKLELATHIVEHWKPYNRSRGLNQLAKSVGENDPTQLPEILKLLSEDERAANTFLSEALDSAQPDDFAVWLELAGSLGESRQKAILKKLAGQLVPSRVPRTWFHSGGASFRQEQPSYEDLQAILEQSRGTAIEALIQKRLDGLVARFEEQKAEMAVQAAHSGKAGGGVQDSPEQVKREISSRLERSRTLEFRAVVRGHQTVARALQNQASVIEESLAEGQRGNAFQRLLTEAMLIDPVAAFEFGGERLTGDELGRAFGETRDHDLYSVLARSKMLSQLFETPHWEQLPDRADYLFDTIEKYRAHHVGQSTEWVRSLPRTVIDELENAKYPRASVLTFIEEVRSK